MDDDQGYSPRGNYLTQQRYLDLERKIAASEARMTARMDELERRLAAVGGDVWESVRAQAGALVNLLKDHAGRT